MLCSLLICLLSYIVQRLLVVRVYCMYNETFAHQECRLRRLRCRVVRAIRQLRNWAQQRGIARKRSRLRGNGPQSADYALFRIKLLKTFLTNANVLRHFATLRLFRAILAIRIS